DPGTQPATAVNILFRPFQVRAVITVHGQYVALGVPDVILLVIIGFFDDSVATCIIAETDIASAFAHLSRLAIYRPGNITDTGRIIPDQVTDAVVGIITRDLTVQVSGIIGGGHRIPDMV